MKKCIHIICLAAILACSCAKLDTSEPTNAAAKRFFLAWMKVHHPDAKPIGMGTYIIEDKIGSGDKVKADNFVFLELEVRTLDSTVVSYNTEKTAQQIHKYKATNDYGAEAKKFARTFMSAGEMDILAGGKNGEILLDTMRIGGTRKAVVPSWLTSISSYYNTAAEYENSITGTDYIYSFTVTGQTDDIIKWQIDSIMRTRMVEPQGYIMNAGDSLKTHRGNLFLKRNTDREHKRGVTKKVRPDYKFPSDTTFYVNYVGRLLDGKVFDTNIEDTAKVHRIWSASRSYTPQAIKASADSAAFTMGSSSVIKGFSLAMYHMHPFESATAVMTSDYAYGNNDKDEIRPYSALIFELDIVDKP